MLNANSFTRKEMTKEAKELEILDDEIQSRFEKILGQKVLCQTLVEFFDTMVQLRMMAEYGDYLAYTCMSLNGNDMDHVNWKVNKLDWQAVAERLEKEESTLAERRARRLPIHPTPYLDYIREAATRLGYDVSLVRYQILAYADRNSAWDSLTAMIHDGHFSGLAKRILEDKRALAVVFREKPDAQKEMGELIEMVQKEWFDILWMDQRQHVVFLPSVKGREKWLSMAPPSSSTL